MASLIGLMADKKKQMAAAMGDTDVGVRSKAKSKRIEEVESRKEKAKERPSKESLPIKKGESAKDYGKRLVDAQAAYDPKAADEDE
jgi:hypothetical protein